MPPAARVGDMHACPMQTPGTPPIPHVGGPILTPGAPTSIAFDLPDVYHVFRRGHRIMVQVQSSWFPLVDRNPQQFMDIPKAASSDFKKATERVYHTAKQPSSITVLIEGAQ